MAADLLACLKEVLPPEVDAEAVAAKMAEKGYDITTAEPAEKQVAAVGPSETDGGVPADGEPVPMDEEMPAGGRGLGDAHLLAVVQRAQRASKKT
jgi:hypothetical protein